MENYRHIDASYEDLLSNTELEYSMEFKLIFKLILNIFHDELLLCLCLHCKYVWLLFFLMLKRVVVILLSPWKMDFFSFFPGFSRKVVVSKGLCLVRCLEIADDQCASTCQVQSQVSLYTFSPGFVVDFSWKMVHIRQVLVSS